MTIRNVYYEITSFHTLMIADTHVSKGKRENTERLRFTITEREIWKK